MNDGSDTKQIDGRGTSQEINGTATTSAQNDDGAARGGEATLQKRTRPKWLAMLTQHGEKPPFMLQFRSSDGFIIGTVSLAVFTVCTLDFRRWFAQDGGADSKLGHVSVWRHCARRSICDTVTRSH